MLKFEVIPVTQFAQNCSPIWCDETNLAALIDPGGEAEKLLVSVVWSDAERVDYMLEGTVNGAGSALDWLANLDANPEPVARIMRETYGDDARLWTRRWRRFYLATAGLFGDSDGREWGVSHYCLRPA